MHKQSAVNPALIIDDLFDAYMQVQAAKSTLERNKKRKTEGTKTLAPKTAGLSAVLEPYIERIIDNPQMLVPSAKTVAVVGGALAGGTAASMYAPEWAMGPTQEEIDAGKRFNPKRALQASAFYGTLVPSIAKIPTNIRKAALANSAAEALFNARKTLLPVTAVGTLAHAKYKREPLDKAKLLRNLSVAASVSNATLYTAAAMDANSRAFMMDAAKKFVADDKIF